MLVVIWRDQSTGYATLSTALHTQELSLTLMAAGVDLVTVANNHSGDYGAEALLQQKAILKAAGIDQVGSGQHRDEAFEPVFLEAGNVKVAIFSIDATQHRFAAGSAQPGIAYLPLNQPQRWYKELQPRIKRKRSTNPTCCGLS